MIKAILANAPDASRTAVSDALTAADILTHECTCPAGHLVTALIKQSFDVVLVSVDLPGLDRERWRFSG